MFAPTQATARSGQRQVFAITADDAPASRKRKPSYALSATFRQMSRSVTVPPTYGMKRFGFPSMLPPMYHELALGEQRLPGGLIDVRRPVPLCVG
jgi:hypothetical protein